MSTVAGHLVELLRCQGTTHVFGIPSGDWLPYMEAMQADDVEFVLVANEASAGFMATVHGWMTGAPGACYGTFGPGATNLSTGVGSAYLDRSPVLVFTSESPDAMVGRTVQMMIDNQALFRPLTKWSTRLNPANMDHAVARAVRIATAELPGPVHIGLPGGVGDRPAPGSQPRRTAPAVQGAPDDASLVEMVKIFARARRPLLAVGLSAVRMGVGALIARVAERHGIPAVFTPMAKGLLCEDHPSYAGVLMHALSDQVAQTHCQADLVVGVGYDPVEFNYEEWMPQVPLAHIDAEPADIDGTRYPAVLNVLGHIVPALQRLADCEPLRSQWDLSGLARRREAMFRALAPAGDAFGPFAALSILRDVLPDDGIMTCDVGAHTHLIGQAWRTPHPFGQLMTNGWSSMGFGVPAAIAAKIARPQAPVVCVTGDGGFMMMAGEMATARRLGLPVVFVVLKDRALGLIKIKQGRRGKETPETMLSAGDACASDHEFGVPVFPAACAESYRAALERALRADGPVIVEAEISITEYESTILRKHK